MSTFKNWVIGDSIVTAKVKERLEHLAVGDSLLMNDIIEGDPANFCLNGEVLEDGAYLKGQKLYTAPVVSFMRQSSNTFIATTSKNKEYSLLFMPKLNNWCFAKEADGAYADFVIRRREPFALKRPITIQGEACFIPGRDDGTPFRLEHVVLLGLPEGIDNALAAETIEGGKLILPLDQRRGFINANCAIEWHMTFQYPPCDEVGWSELQAFLKKFHTFAYIREKLPEDLFCKEYLNVPIEYGIGIESKSYFIDKVTSFLKIRYMGLTRFYAVVEESRGNVLEIDVFRCDKTQRRLMNSIKKGRTPKFTKASREPCKITI